MSPLHRWLSRVKVLFGLSSPQAEYWSRWEARLRRVVHDDIERVLPYFPPDGVIVDVGANVGIFTACMLERRPQARAYCFEPVESFYERCRLRFEGNPNVHVERLALGDQNERSTIFKSSHNQGGNSLVLVHVERYRKETGAAMESEEVEVRVFDDWAREVGLERVDLIKTDTEGYDSLALLGALPFLRRTGQRPLILAELQSKAFHHAWVDQERMIAGLYELGYQKVDLDSMRDIDDIMLLPGGLERVETSPA
jgi:FkbM family methyltransferase